MSSFAEVVCVMGKNSQFSQLSKLIESEHLKVHCIDNSDEVISIIQQRKPALVMMDLLLEGKDAIDLLKEMELKGLRRFCSVVILSDRRENYVEITALNSGADDFLVKPVNKRVFVSRLRAWMRSHATLRGAISIAKNGEEIVLDRDRYTLITKGEEYLLQRKEFEIISLLASKPKKVFSRDEIKELVWGEPNHLVRNRTIDVHIRNLRVKIGRRYIKTYKGVGYSFDTSLSN
ncbi:response regulator transcription factor [Cryomorphaceae bacterium 1068]|nr:response regulator transcription factor [Cryomorphaceae bacterium 1068]